METGKGKTYLLGAPRPSGRRAGGVHGSVFQHFEETGHWMKNQYDPHRYRSFSSLMTIRLCAGHSAALSDR
jgi:hypothetical protein